MGLDQNHIDKHIHSIASSLLDVSGCVLSLSLSLSPLFPLSLPFNSFSYSFPLSKQTIYFFLTLSLTHFSPLTHTRAERERDSHPLSSLEASKGLCHMSSTRTSLSPSRYQRCFLIFRTLSHTQTTLTQTLTRTRTSVHTHIHSRICIYPRTFTSQCAHARLHS